MYALGSTAACFNANPARNPQGFRKGSETGFSLSPERNREIGRDPLYNLLFIIHGENPLPDRMSDSSMIWKSMGNYQTVVC